MPISSALAFPKTRTSSALFPEVVDLIVRDKSLDTSDLCRISLISRVWAEPSQRRLFTFVRLDPERDHPLYHVDPKSSTARLIRYIKHLTLFSTTTDSWMPFPSDSEEDALVRIQEKNPEPDDALRIANDSADDDNDNNDVLHDHDYFSYNSAFIGNKLGGTHVQIAPDPETCISTRPGFITFLHRLSRLEALTVRNRLNWYLLPLDVVQAFLHIFNLDTFRYLDIWRGSAIRFPFIFLHFCPNLEHLSLNVRPTTLLDVKGVDAQKSLSLRGKPPTRPIALKLTSANVVHSISHYIDIGQTNILGINSISLDRLRALYIAYYEDPSDAATGGIWPSKRVGEFLSSFGHNLEELTLEVDHRSTTSRAASAVPANNLSNLANLKHLRLYIYNGILPELDFNEGFSWLLPFLQSLPNPSKLMTFQFFYASTFKWTRDFDSHVRFGESLLEELFDVLATTTTSSESSASFGGLEDVRVQFKLRCMNGPSASDPPSCSLSTRSDYNGLVTLRSRKVHTCLRVAVLAGYDKELV